MPEDGSEYNLGPGAVTHPSYQERVSGKPQYHLARVRRQARSCLLRPPFRLGSRTTPGRATHSFSIREVKAREFQLAGFQGPQAEALEAAAEKLERGRKELKAVLALLENGEKK